MSFFQPTSDPTTTSVTPSPFDQSLAQFKMNLLASILDNAAGNRPTFKSFVNGGPATTPFPGGLGALTGPVLAAAQQPGAFTSNKVVSGGGDTPSTLSDLTQLGLLGAVLYNSGLIGASGNALGNLGSLLKPVGGLLNIGGTSGANSSFGSANPSPLQSTADSSGDFVNSLDTTSGLSPSNTQGLADFLSSLGITGA